MDVLETIEVFLTGYVMFGLWYLGSALGVLGLIATILLIIYAFINHKPFINQAKFGLWIIFFGIFSYVLASIIYFIFG